MKVISAILTFIKFIPDIIKIIKEVLNLVRDHQDKVEAKEKAKKVAEAIKTARETKDTGDLEKMFGKSFEINFIVPSDMEKKSLELGLLKFDVKIDERNRLADKIIDLQKQEAKIPELKKIEDLVNASLSEETPEDPVTEEPKKSFGFFSFGRAGSVIEGASFISNVRMSGDARMSSKFFAMALLCFTVISCKETEAINQPNYQPKLYAGDSSLGGLYRKQSRELVRATDPKMDDMVGMTYDTFACLHKTYIQNCREYKAATVKCDGVSVQFIKDVIKSVGN